MATITGVRSSPAVGIEKIFWETLTATNNVGSAFILHGVGSASVQVTGTFGGAVTLEGSNDGTTYATLEDNAGNAITGTAAYVADFTPSTLYIRPAAAAGVSDVDVTVVHRSTT